MPKPIETPRLELRPVSLNDFEFLKKMNTDAEVMIHIGSGSIRTTEESQKALDRYLVLAEQYPFLGQWVVHEKSAAEDIGTFVLRHPATLEKVEGLEIGFAYTPSSWGKGFATEAAKGVIGYVQKWLPGEKVIGIVDAENKTSKQVLTKIGMKHIGATIYVNPVNGEQKECLLMRWEIDSESQTSN